MVNVLLLTCGGVVGKSSCMYWDRRLEEEETNHEECANSGFKQRGFEYLYPSSSVPLHPSGVQSSNPVLDVGDLRTQAADFSRSCQQVHLSGGLTLVTSLWVFWTLAAACATLSSSSNSKAVEPLKLPFDPCCRPSLSKFSKKNRNSDI